MATLAHTSDTATQIKFVVNERRGDGQLRSGAQAFSRASREFGADRNQGGL